MAEATHDKDNPFSFKSFMKRTSTDLTGHSEQLEKGGKNVKSTKKKKETRRKKNNDDVLFPEVEDPEKGMWNYKLNARIQLMDYYLQKMLTIRSRLQSLLRPRKRRNKVR